MNDDFISLPIATSHRIGVQLQLLINTDSYIAINKPDQISSLDIIRSITNNISQPQFQTLNITHPELVFYLPNYISGILIISKNKESSAILRNQYGSDLITLKFDCLTHRNNQIPTDQAITCSLPIAKHINEDRMLISTRTGKKSKTTFSFVENISNIDHWTATTTFLRNDQILLHAYECDISIVNDYKYSSLKSLELDKKFSKTENDEPHWTRSYIPIHLSNVIIRSEDNNDIITATLPKRFQSLIKLATRSNKKTGNIRTNRHIQQLK